MNIVILGPQGSGKGTQAKLTADKFNLIHIETGKLLREIADSNDPLSEEIKKIMNEGRLVSDSILEKVISSKLRDNHSGNGFVFDGTPRNRAQYDKINELLSLSHGKLDKVIVINISEDETLRRLSSRRTCEECGKVYNVITNPSPKGEFCECGGKLVQREDDKPESIRKRLQTYNEHTSKVISMAKKDGILYVIDGERPIGEIFAEITVILEKIDG